MGPLSTVRVESAFPEPRGGARREVGEDGPMNNTLGVSRKGGREMASSGCGRDCGPSSNTHSLLFLDTQPDDVSQPPFQLCVTRRLSASQRSVRQWVCLLYALCTFPFVWLRPCKEGLGLGDGRAAQRKEIWVPKQPQN